MKLYIRHGVLVDSIYTNKKVFIADNAMQGDSKDIRVVLWNTHVNAGWINARR